MGLRVLAIGHLFIPPIPHQIFNPSFNIDTGEAKREMVLKLGAEKWVDFKESQDLIKDVKAATDGGPQAAIVAAGDVRRYLPSLLVMLTPA